MTSRLPRYEAKCVQRRCFQSLCVQISRERSYSLPIYWCHSKCNWLCYNFAADSFYVMLIFALDKLNIRHISTSGLLTYWSRKCVTWCVPHDESFHEVWSWCDHPLPSYSIIACDTLRDLMTLTFDLLTLVSGHTWRVTWSIHPPSLKILRLSVLWRSYGYPFLSYKFWHLP